MTGCSPQACVSSSGRFKSSLSAPIPVDAQYTCTAVPTRMHKRRTTLPIRELPRTPVLPVIHLMPGEWYFGQRKILRTLLGSCVALTLWHPERRVGGLCHYLLPERKRQGVTPLNGRYGDEVLELMVRRMTRYGTQAQDYVVQLHGGASVLTASHVQSSFNVGDRNIEQGRLLIKQYGFRLQGESVGDSVARQVSIDLETGAVHVRRGARMAR